MGKTTQQWRKGPINDRLVDTHDRSIHCMSVLGDEVVTGSADHGLKCVDVPSGKIKRELYNKKFGHTEWVTSVVHLPDGRILSGAMDSKLCLWHQSKVQCTDLLGHKASITKVQASQDGSNIGLSSSFDGTVKVWDLDKYNCIHTLQNSKGHTKNVNTFFWENSLVVSGDKNAKMCVWDINTAQLVSTLEEHNAPVTEITVVQDKQDVLVSGGLDGNVCIWDLRSCNVQHKISAVQGSVNALTVAKDVPQDPTACIVVGGSDNMVRILDPRKGYQVSKELPGHKDIVTCLSLVDNLCFSGGGNGWVLVHDMLTGACLYGVGTCEQAPCKCIEIIAPKYFLAGGEDGKLVLFDYQ